MNEYHDVGIFMQLLSREETLSGFVRNWSGDSLVPENAKIFVTLKNSNIAKGN
jgi:hypothetical protein